MIGRIFIHIPVNDYALDSIDEKITLYLGHRFV